MLTTYYTYRRLAREWNVLLAGHTVVGAYSGSRHELVIEISDGSAIVFGMRGGLRYLFRSERQGRPRRNVAPLLECARGEEVVAVGIADRDRMLTFHGRGGLDILFVLYGSRPNVLVVEGPSVVDAFKYGGTVIGKAPPLVRPASHPHDTSALRATADGDAASYRRTISRAYPLFDRELVLEVLYRVRADPDREFDVADAETLHQVAMEVVSEIEEEAAPRIYWEGGYAEAFGLITLHRRANLREESFDTVDAAVGVFCRRKLAQSNLSERLGPVRKLVRESASRARRRLAELEAHLRQPSRADIYEKWGHLLMASGRGSESGRKILIVEDAFERGEPVEIALEVESTIVENARRYYDRARRTRLSRESAEARIEETRREAEILGRDEEAVEEISSVEQLDSFLKSRAERLSRLEKSSGGARETGISFRRFDLKSDYAVYVGRSAQENDDLTFRFARKYDIWMHARGVRGSHTILRLPHRESIPDPHILESAASIAAYFSKARGSALVPVAYAPRKYVRKVKGAAPGKVIVDLETVLLVPPLLPKDRA